MKYLVNIGDVPFVADLHVTGFNKSPYTDTETLVTKYNDETAFHSGNEQVPYVLGVSDVFSVKDLMARPLPVIYTPVNYSDDSGDWVQNAPNNKSKEIDFANLAVLLSRQSITASIAGFTDGQRHNLLVSHGFDGPSYQTVVDRPSNFNDKNVAATSLTDLAAWECCDRRSDDDVASKLSQRTTQEQLDRDFSLRYGIYSIPDNETYLNVLSLNIAEQFRNYFYHSDTLGPNTASLIDAFSDNRKKGLDPLIKAVDSKISDFLSDHYDNVPDGDAGLFYDDLLRHKDILVYFKKMCSDTSELSALEGKIAFVYCKGADGKPAFFINTKLAPFAFTSHTNVLTGQMVTSIVEAKCVKGTFQDGRSQELYGSEDSFIDLKTFLSSTKLSRDVSGLILYPAILLPRVSSDNFATTYPKAAARSLVMADYVSRTKYFKLTPDATLADDWASYRSENRLSPITSLQANKAAELYDCMGYMFAKVTIESQDYFNVSLFDILAKLQGTTPLVVWETPPTDVSITYKCARKGSEANIVITSKGKTANITFDSGKYGDITADENYVEFIKFIKSYSNTAGLLYYKADFNEPSESSVRILPSNLFFENAGIHWAKLSRTDLVSVFK